MGSKKRARFGARVRDWFARLFRNPRASQVLSAIFLLLAIAGLATTCRAGETQTQFGMGSTYARSPTPVLDLAVTTTLGAPGDARWQYGLTLVGSSTYMDREQGNQAALSAMLVDGFGRFDVGLGVAFVQNLDIYNGSHANFSLMLAYRFQRLPITIAIRHWSNAGTKYPNLGRDFAILSWRF